MARYPAGLIYFQVKLEEIRIQKKCNAPVAELKSDSEDWN